MEYNNYYSPQVGPPPPLQPQVSQQQQQPQLGVSQMQQQQQPSQMMHAPMPQHIRQTMPGPPSHQMQQQQLLSQAPQQQQLGHHPQQQPPPPQHPNYHQIAPPPPHPHGHPMSHSSSPHQPSPQSTQQHPMQSSHQHHPGHPPQMHMSPQQSLNQMGRPPMGPSPVMNHPQSNLQPPLNQHGNFIGGPMSGPPPPPPSSVHHPPQHHPHHPHHQQHHHNPNQPQILHHPPPPSHLHQYNPIGRHSPYYHNPTQTEFKILEMNRRLQTKPMMNRQLTPLPIHSQFDESMWWEQFANDFFEPNATLLYTICQEDKQTFWKIGRTLIPRFFRSYFDGGVTDLSINLRNPKEICCNTLLTLECDHAIIVTNHQLKHAAITPGPKAVVHTEGRLILEFNQNCDEPLIKTWTFYIKQTREYIDRSIYSMPMIHPNSIEPVTRHGLTKATLFYLKMCTIIEPMQDLMTLYKQTKQEPAICMKNFLIDRYNFRSGDDSACRSQTNKRRKRKPSAPNNVTGGTTKKSKANANNANMNNSNITNNSNSLTNNIVMSPAATSTATVAGGAPQAPSFSLVSQDVMVVGEPALMGGDFGDDNERLITRMENTQYDPSASNTTESETVIISNNSSNVNVNNNNDDNGVSLSTNGSAHGGSELHSEEASLSPSLLHQSLQRQQEQQQHQGPHSQASQQPQPQPTSPLQQQQQQLQPQQQPQQNSLPQRNTQTPKPNIIQQGLSQENSSDSGILSQLMTEQAPIQEEVLIEQEQHEQEQEQQHPEQQELQDTRLQQPRQQQTQQQPQQQQAEIEYPKTNSRQSEIASIGALITPTEDVAQANSLNNNTSNNNNNNNNVGDSNQILNASSKDATNNNHSNSVAPLNEESNLNSQAPPDSSNTHIQPCSNNAPATTAVDQQHQRVDNGVA